MQRYIKTIMNNIILTTHIIKVNNNISKNNEILERIRFEWDNINSDVI